MADYGRRSDGILEEHGASGVLRLSGWIGHSQLEGRDAVCEL